MKKIDLDKPLKHPLSAKKKFDITLEFCRQNKVSLEDATEALNHSDGGSEYDAILIYVKELIQVLV